MTTQQYTPEKAVEGAWNILGKLFWDPAARKDPEMLRLGRIAGSTVQSWSRMQASENQAEAIRAMVARELASENGDEFKKHYGLPERRQLPRGRR